MMEYSDKSLSDISEALRDLYSHTEISDLFKYLNYDDGYNSNSSQIVAGYYVINKPSKAKRIKQCLLKQSNPIGVNTVIEYFVNPKNFKPVAENEKKHGEAIKNLNEVLVFYKCNVSKEGKIAITHTQPNTISEAKKILADLKDTINSRGMHKKLLDFCKEEYFNGNYFHCIVEACKGVYSLIRSKTKLEYDGFKLIDTAFHLDSPYLLVEGYDDSDNKRNEQMGLSHLCKGIHQFYRNPLSHTAKVEYPKITKEKALEILTIISFIYNELDKVTVVKVKELANY